MAVRELTTDRAVLARLVELTDRDVLDVGCGDGALVRELASRGARAVGLETSVSQLHGAPERPATGSVGYIIGRAEALPLADQSVDAVLFMRSLHHVPIGSMGDAVAEAARVLRPGGVVYVAEPLPEGDYWELVRIVEDETEVRAAAQAAVSAAARTMEHARHEYEVGAISNLEHLRTRIVGVDPGRADAFDARAEELAEALGRLGEPCAGGRWFTQPMRVDVLRPGSLPTSS